MRWRWYINIWNVIVRYCVIMWRIKIYFQETPWLVKNNGIIVWLAKIYFPQCIIWNFIPIRFTNGKSKTIPFKIIIWKSIIITIIKRNSPDPIVYYWIIGDEIVWADCIETDCSTTFRIWASKCIIGYDQVIYDNEEVFDDLSSLNGGKCSVRRILLRHTQERIGGYQVGEIYGTPIFKVPSSIIPDDELMTVWKNDSNEADVAVAFGTLVPFFSTGTIQRKNFYKEAGLASYGDHQVLQPKYLGRIIVENIRGV